ncbi:MAG: ABC transporter ATP-binding protein [Tindallia sp. MSAO_Bac2]|nr:MAG: ABC transporter ATP-binding protein [Tindallia sp. MSAO_Bac2]
MIQVEQLQFSYDRHKAFIEDLSFDVPQGEIFGFLGPSGAGKSTLQKILCGIILRYQGQVKVLGTEAKEHGADFYEKIGVDFEFPNLYGKFTGLENLQYFSSLYKKKPLDPLPLLDRLGLREHAGKKVSAYSKGMKMRLAFVRAILHQPELLFLDEPTSGLDPSYARILKDMILEQKQAGRTIILTTHNMHDADELCDRVAFLVDGEMKALGVPEDLKCQQAGVEVHYRYGGDGTLKEGRKKLSELHQDAVFMENLRKGSIASIHSKEKSLEDVFIELTGRKLL